MLKLPPHCLLSHCVILCLPGRFIQFDMFIELAGEKFSDNVSLTFDLLQDHYQITDFEGTCLATVFFLGGGGKYVAAVKFGKVVS